jgi:hypothetical protein
MFDYDPQGGYNIAQVDDYLVKMTEKFVYATEQQRELIADLQSQLHAAEQYISKQKLKSEEATQAMVQARQKTEEVERLTASKYNLELQRLRTFHAKWLVHYQKMIELYPIDSTLKEMAEYNDRMNVALDMPAHTPKSRHQQHAEVLNKIGAYFASQDAPKVDSAPTFDYKEALMPTQSLDEILKSLGVG